MEYDNEAMSAGMGGGKASVGMEGFLHHHKNDTGDITMKWHGFLSDEKQQDARTSFHNCFKFIKHMQEKKGLLPRNGKSVLHIQSDGCTVQYKCANALKLVALLSDIFAIEIDWMITAPHHGKGLHDALAGLDKHYLANAMIRGMDSAQCVTSISSRSVRQKSVATS